MVSCFYDFSRLRGSSYVAKEIATNFLIVRDEGKKKEKIYSNILAAVDGSAISYLAFNRAADIAKETGAALHAVHVRSSKEQDSAEGEMDVLEKVKELAADKQIAVEIHEEGGHPGNVIVKLADDLGSDLIVAGSLGKSAINLFSENPRQSTVGAHQINGKKILRHTVTDTA